MILSKLLPGWFNLIGIILIVSSFRIEAQDKALVNTIKSPYANLHGIDMGAVHWTSGFWAERFKIAEQVMVPMYGEKLYDPGVSAYFQNFEIAAGIKEGVHKGAPFSDGDYYKWFEGIASVYSITRSDSLDRVMDNIIEIIGRCQETDGYIYTGYRIAHNNGDLGVTPLSKDFETYNLGHLMTAAAVHYRTTGKKSLLNIAIKTTDYLYKVFKENQSLLISNSICPSHYMGVVEMYRLTNKPEYLELAKGLIDIRDKTETGSFHNQNHKPFREQQEAIGHSVRANYLYAGVADLYTETGDSTLLRPLEDIWTNVVETKIYVTGATGGLYDGVAPNGTTTNQPSIQQIHQAYGQDFELQNITGHNETCANIGNVLWNWRMHLITGKSRYIDILELSLYNSVLSGVSLDGTSYCYTNPLRIDKNLPYKLRWPKVREPYISGPNCCPPNVVRTVAQIQDYAYSMKSNSLYVNLYGSNTLSASTKDGAKILLEQTTGFPWDGTIQLKLSNKLPKDFAINLRIPGWADRAEILINNSRLENTPIKPGSYVEIKKNWAKGDIIILKLPMDVQFLEANPLVEATINQVAVKRGPLVYCMEKIDFPGETSMFDILLSSDSALKPSSETIGSTQIIALTGTGLLKEEDKQWKNQLYQPINNSGLKKIPVKLIPYYSWGNRGLDDMTVWIPFSW